MSDLLKKTFWAGAGFMALSREKIEHILDNLIARGELTQTSKKGLLEELLQAVEQKQLALSKFISAEIQRILKKLDIPTRAELEELKQKIDQHEHHPENTPS